MAAQPGYTRKIEPLTILSAEQVDQVHRATLQVLWQTGVRMDDAAAVDLLEREGCVVDRASSCVRFPADLVEEALRRAPGRFTVLARDPANNVEFSADRLHFSHSSGMHTIDLETFEPRPATRAEFIDCIRILDALPTISCLGCYPYFGFEGVPPTMSIPEGVALAMRHSTKHQTTCYTNDCEIFTIQMAQALGTEISGAATSTAPLMWGAEALTEVCRMVAAGFPIVTIDGCLMGGTGPVTAPGSVVVSNAEQLALITLVQLMQPGHRILVGHFAGALHMATGNPAFGELGASLNNAISNQMWRHYGLPCGNGSPGYTSAKTMDYQAGYEKSMAALISALSGVNHLLLHFGVAAEITAHPVQAVLDDDVAAMIGRFVAGDEINDDTLAVDLITSVGPVPGQFLDTKHTARWWRKALVMPRAADRLSYGEWLAADKRGAVDLARERCEAILAEHHAPPLAPAQEEDLERILSDARRYYRDKGMMA